MAILLHGLAMSAASLMDRRELLTAGVEVIDREGKHSSGFFTVGSHADARGRRVSLLRQPVRYPEVTSSAGS
jgi:hypothetical protein